MGTEYFTYHVRISESNLLLYEQVIISERVIVIFCSIP